MSEATHNPEGMAGVQGRLRELASQIASDKAEREREHAENTRRLDTLGVVLHGVPGDKENIGLVRTVDRIEGKIDSSIDVVKAYVTTTRFWGGVMVTIIIVVLSALGLWFNHLEHKGTVSKTSDTQVASQLAY